MHFFRSVLVDIKTGICQDFEVIAGYLFVRWGFIPHQFNILILLPNIVVGNKSRPYF